MKFGKLTLAAGLAGAVNGLLGAGGGMVLVPLLSVSGELKEEEIFPSSVMLILPLCVVSLAISAIHHALPWSRALPYLLGSLPGGILAGYLGKRIPSLWLHRALGALILWGGIRYLWP